jgi:hypothetical protein
MRFFTSLRYVQNDRHLHIIERGLAGGFAASKPPLYYTKLSHCHSER